MALPTRALPGWTGSWFGVGQQQEAALGSPPRFISCPCPAAVTLTVESEEEDESDSSETEKDDDEGIIFVARATSEILQEGKISGNGVLPVSLPSGASWSCSVGFLPFCSWPPLQTTPFSYSLIYSPTSIYQSAPLYHTLDIHDLIQPSQPTWKN